MNERKVLGDGVMGNQKEETKLSNRSLSVVKKTISIPKTDIESIELVDSLICKCNDFNYGRQVTLSDIALFAFRKLKPEDLKLIKDSTLTIEEKTEEALFDFNKRNGTSFTLLDMAMKQLKKEKKDVAH